MKRSMRKRRIAAIAVVGLGGVLGALAACGEDDPPPPPPKGQATPAPAAGGAAGAPGAGSNKLAPQAHAEDQVACKEPPPEQRTKTCDPTAPTCDKNQYCIETSSGLFCGPCPERDAIRHVFKERDFVVAESNRDPFQSYLNGGIGTGSGSGELPKDLTDRCRSKEQLVATNYSYQDLKIVGIVAQGTRRKVLMMDTGNAGHIIKLGDCVGKEKALVKDIGAGYITFSFDPDGPGAGKAEEHSVQLHPTQVSVTSLPSEGQPEPGTPPPPDQAGAPVVAPPPLVQGSTGGAGPTRGNTVIVPIQQPQQVPVVPPQAPTNLRP